MPFFSKGRYLKVDKKFPHYCKALNCCLPLLNIIYRIIFWLTIIFIVSTIFVLTIGQSLPIEFKDNKIKNDYYNFIFNALPFSLLLTLFGTIKKKNEIGKNWAIGVLTVLSAGLSFFVLVGIMFSVGFSAWESEVILYRNQTDKNIIINQQIFDVGALGYGGHRTAQLTPFLKYFYIVRQVDTTKIDKTQWILVNEEGDIHYP